MLGGPGWGNAITCFWVVIMFFIFVFAFFYYEKKKNKNKANDKQTTNQEVEND